MILLKTYLPTGATVSLMRDARPGDVGFDPSPGRFQSLVDFGTGHGGVVVDKYNLASSNEQQWPTVTNSTPETWPPT